MCSSPLCPLLPLRRSITAGGVQLDQVERRSALGAYRELQLSMEDLLEPMMEHPEYYTDERSTGDWPCPF